MFKEHSRYTKVRPMTSLASPVSSDQATLTNPAFQAYAILRSGFAVAPILFGLDKFAEVLTDHWTAYLWPGVDSALPGSANDAMLVIGVIEIVAGILVAVAPRIGAPVVAAWLGGIIVNLLLVGGYADIALRDFGLLLAAAALARLAAAFPNMPVVGE